MNDLSVSPLALPSYLAECENCSRSARCALTITTAQAQTAPKMKMTTDIPPELITPDSVETRRGTLKFFDGFPDDAAVGGAGGATCERVGSI
jgi:hypothetical protein